MKPDRMASEGKGQIDSHTINSYNFLFSMSASTYYDYDVSSANVATFSNRYNENLSYDLRGNILTMNRTGSNTAAGSCLYNPCKRKFAICAY